jgi:DNA-binding NtrC family response regulator
MQTQNLNLFIVDDNRSMVTALKQYLQNKFGFGLKISTFNDGESCLQKINDNTHIVILDHHMQGKDGVEVLKSIKAINPKTEVIMLSGSTDITVAINSFKAGAIDYVVKGPRSWNKITSLVNRLITTPIKIIAREFGVSKYMAMFMITFVVMGVVVCVALQILK